MLHSITPKESFCSGDVGLGTYRLKRCKGILTPFHRSDLGTRVGLLELKVKNDNPSHD